jgi:hypothetical protein
MATPKLKKVTSLFDLFALAKKNDAYAELLRVSSANLGGPRKDSQLEVHYRWLLTNAAETEAEGGGESGVLDEVNSCRQFIKV